MKEIITDSLRYWEYRRIGFNLALGLVVAGSFIAHHPTLPDLTWQPFVGLALAAAVANVLYCAVYPVDLMLQVSAFQAAWCPRRWILLAAGTLFAAALFLFHE